MKKILIRIGIVIGIILIASGIYFEKQPIDCIKLTSLKGSLDNGAVSIDETSKYKGIFMKGDNLELNRGKYKVTVYYETNTNRNCIVVNDNGDEFYFSHLKKKKKTNTFTFELNKDSKKLSITSYYDGVGNIKIKGYRIKPVTVFNYDFIYYTCLLYIVLAGIYLYYDRKKKIEKDKIIPIIVLAIVTFIASVPFMRNSITFGDDLIYHLGRIEGIKFGIESGQLPVTIYPEHLSGHGYLASLYPNLFLYIPALLRLCNVSLVTAYNSFIILINIATTMCAYIAGKKISKSTYAGTLCAVFCTLSPYRIYNITYRAAVGEGLAMIFLPIVILGFYELFNENKKSIIYLVIGFTGVLQSHLLTTILIAIVSVVLCLIYIKRFSDEKRLFNLLKAAGITILLNLWYIIPFIYYYLTKLQLDALIWMNYGDYVLKPSKLVEVLSFKAPTTIGLGLVISVILSVFLLIKNRKIKTESMKFSIILFILGIIFSIFTTSLMPYGLLKKIKIINKFFTLLQFPWRLLCCSSVLLAIGASVIIDKNLNKINTRKNIFISIIILTIIPAMTIFTCYLLKGNYINKNDSYVSKENEQDDGAAAEYIPANTDSYNLITNSKVIISNGEAVKIVDYYKRFTNVTVKYNCSKDGQYIEVPLLYYPGYRATDDKNNLLEVVNGENNRIRIYINATNKDKVINISFKGVWINKFALIVTVLGIINMLLYYILHYNEKTKSFDNELKLEAEND